MIVIPEDCRIKYDTGYRDYLANHIQWSACIQAIYDNGTDEFRAAADDLHRHRMLAGHACLSCVATTAHKFGIEVSDEPVEPKLNIV